MTDEELVLAQLRDGATKPAQLKRPSDKIARAAALESLIAAGRVAKRKKGSSVTLALTDEGKRVADGLGAMPAPLKASRARAPKASAPTIDVAEITAQVTARVVGELREVLDELAARVAKIEARLDEKPASPRPPSPPSSSARIDGLKPAILDQLHALDTRLRLGGVVPIPTLREALRTSGVNANAVDVDAALVALEREYRVDLLVAQSPTTLADPSQGIQRPGRGLVYYVARRAEAS